VLVCLLAAVFSSISPLAFLFLLWHFRLHHVIVLLVYSGVNNISYFKKQNKKKSTLSLLVTKLSQNLAVLKFGHVPSFISHSTSSSSFFDLHSLVSVPLFAGFHELVENLCEPIRKKYRKLVHTYQFTIRNMLKELCDYPLPFFGSCFPPLIFLGGVFF